jgi:putative transcriptional regulator
MSASAMSASSMSSVNLTNHFLIAMPSMADPYFSRSLTFICEHNDQGALGLVVNRPIDMTLQALFERLSLKLRGEFADYPIYFGGPVQTDRGFVLHAPAGNWQSTLRVREAIGLTTSKDILEAVGRGEGPRRLLVTLGYAGWSPGQLEHELSQNAWLTVEAKEGILFETPAEERLPAAMDLLGLDFARLQDEAGHA